MSSVKFVEKEECRLALTEQGLCGSLRLIIPGIEGPVYPFGGTIDVISERESIVLLITPASVFSYSLVSPVYCDRDDDDQDQ